MRSPQLAESLTATEPISTALEDGSVVEGTMGFHPSRRVASKSPMAASRKWKRGLMGVEYMRSGALILLREMAHAQRLQSAPSKPAKNNGSSKKKRD